jgi:uncharacterized protein YfeS
MTDFETDLLIGCEMSGRKFCYHFSAAFYSCSMDDEIPSIRISSEEFMDEVPAIAAGSRRNEDIALDLMKFVAMTTGYGRTSSSGVGFQGSGC